MLIWLITMQKQEYEVKLLPFKSFFNYWFFAFIITFQNYHNLGFFVYLMLVSTNGFNYFGRF